MHSPTRGFGVLEQFLAKRRAAIADKHIHPAHRTGHILDIGCGTTPLFLSQTQFASKTGIDKSDALLATTSHNSIKLHQHNLATSPSLPFADKSFETVTMLAVWEHLDEAHLPNIAAEVRRILKEGGRFILTTPSPWTNWILKSLARVHLLSPEEIREHHRLYSHAEIRNVLTKAGFTNEIRTGFFECSLNQWLVACA